METNSQLAPLNGLTAGESAAFQSGLWQLLARQTALYTMDDHSSVPVETAEELLASIRFLIGLSLEKLSPEAAAQALRQPDLKPLLAGGIAEAEGQIAQGKALLRRAMAGAFQSGNIAYHDTLKEIALFFRRYDHRYFAHQVPCMIDYQLANGLTELDWHGISFVNEYLRRLNWENDFCNRFDRTAALALIRASCPDYVGLLVNLYEPLAVNALGLILLEQDVFALHIGETQRQSLLTRFRTWTEKEAAHALEAAAHQLCLALALPQLGDYISATASGLHARLKGCLPTGNLSQVFLSL